MSTEKKPLKIAFIGARGIGSAYSGIETYYEEIGSRLVERGHEVIAYCRRHATPEGVDMRGVQPVFRPCLKSKHGETFSHTLVSTADVLFRGMDIVQFHALGPALFSAVPRIVGAKTVASIRGLDWQREKWGPFARGFLQFCESSSYKLPDAVSVVSETLAEHYRQAHGAQVRCIPNGVNIVESPEPSEIHSLGLQGNDYFLYMGRLSPEKGLDTLLEAYGRVRGRARLVIAGGGSYTDSFVEELHRSAPDDVIFTGRVGGRLKHELYANALAYVLPSTIEGLSVALLEAMSFGTCVVTSDIPENRELAEGVGHCVPTGNAEALGATLERVLTSPDETADLARRGQERVRTHYTWDEVARRTEEFYYEILGAGHVSHKMDRAA